TICNKNHNASPGKPGLKIHRGRTHNLTDELHPQRQILSGNRAAAEHRRAFRYSFDYTTTIVPVLLTT
ncbi:hypothetical protein, partial [Escherichia coli]|uniref:hypothetical protein n=1 Tax=Escherichia coli TaxID=562 RepID=UPI002280E1FF